MEYRVDSWKWRLSSLFDSMYDTLWVELTFSDVMENFVVYTRFMFMVSFTGLWFMENFLYKIHNVC